MKEILMCLGAFAVMLFGILQFMNWKKKSPTLQIQAEGKTIKIQELYVEKLLTKKKKHFMILENL